MLNKIKITDATESFREMTSELREQTNLHVA